MAAPNAPEHRRLATGHPAQLATRTPGIMGFARDHLLPWVDKNLPGLAPDMRQAFADLDQLAVEARKTVRSAWQHVRAALLGQTAEFVRLLGNRNEWAVRITSYLQSPRHSGKPVVRVITEQQLDYDDLPANVRQDAVARGLDRTSIDIVKARDQLLAEH